MKILEEHYEALPEAVRNLANKNAAAAPRLGDRDGISSLTFAISAFKWKDTPEGFQFWDFIFDHAHRYTAGEINLEEFHSACLAALAEIAEPVEADPEMESDPEWEEKVGLCAPSPHIIDTASYARINDSIDLPSAFDTQEGGSHYKDFPIQPTEYCHRNGLNWCEANVVKYVSRHNKKNGIEDLKKARHYLDFLIEMDYPDEA